MTSTGAAFRTCRCSLKHVSLAAFVHIAERQCTTEENFQVGKGLAGLDASIRSAHGPRVTLALLALTFLTIAAATEHEPQPPAAGTIPAHAQRGRSLSHHRHLRHSGTLTAGPGAPVGMATSPTPHHDMS